VSVARVRASGQSVVRQESGPHKPRFVDPVLPSEDIQENGIAGRSRCDASRSRFFLPPVKIVDFSRKF
jgi:hypothetical protein